MKAYQFLIKLTNEQTVIINSTHPINFAEANRRVTELGYRFEVKSVRFLGMIEGLEGD